MVPTNNDADQHYRIRAHACKNRRKLSNLTSAITQIYNKSGSCKKSGFLLLNSNLIISSVIC